LEENAMVNKMSLIEYLTIIQRKKIHLIVLLVVSVALSYLLIYFLIPPKFDSRSVIIASDADQSSGLSSIVKSFSNLPIAVPGLSSGGVDTDIFTTVIYSRTILEKIIHKYSLYKEYGFNTMEETVLELKSNIKAEETEQGAYEITVRSSTPQKAAAMNNFLVDELNKFLVEMNIQKSRDNRIFLEKRYDEVKEKLRNAEDSLVSYQNQSGIFAADEQAKRSLEAYSKLEAELISKQVESSYFAKIYGEQSPITLNSKIAISELEQKVNSIKNGKGGSDLIISLKQLPNKAIKYIRCYRDVQIYNKMLEFIIPLYEQTRFEEQKNIPVLSIIDKAIPAEKKSFPPRTIFALLASFLIVIVFLTFEIVKAVVSRSLNSELKRVIRNIFFLN